MQYQILTFSPDDPMLQIELCAPVHKLSEVREAIMEDTMEYVDGTTPQWQETVLGTMADAITDAFLRYASKPAESAQKFYIVNDATCIYVVKEIN